MAFDSEETSVLHADREHTALRLVVLLLILVLGWLSYRGILLIWAWRSPGSLPDYARVASCAGAVPLALVLAWGVEQLLLRTWHSGNRVLLQPEQICAQWRDGESVCLPLGAQTAVSCYYFSLRDYARGGRERRAPSHWLCVAVQLQDDHEQLVVFTLLPPGKAAVYTEHAAFRRLDPRHVYGKDDTPRVPVRPAIPEEVLQGENGRFWLAERHRWERGVELLAPDFETFMNAVQILDTTNDVPLNENGGTHV